VEEVKVYIESGILELYVLGQLTAEENEEVEAMASKHPEVKAEISAVELAIEEYALENSITPPNSLQDKIFAKIAPQEQEPKTHKDKVKIIPLYQAAGEVKIRTLRYALVACFALLLICAASLYSVNQQLNTAQDQIASLSTQKEQFASTVSKLQFDKAGMENRIAMTETEEWATVKLAGVKKSPDAKMLVYWNKNNKNILINYAAIDLPKTDKTHEYQLWALVNGKPVSLGVFSTTDRAKKAVVQMDRIQNAQAFAVTIEPKGGSINPTMENMVVMGTI
jgi:anti-sigma-K factor RskA